MANAALTAERELEKEQNRQIALNYPAFALALYEEWGWGKKRIQNIMIRTERAWEKCADQDEKSMIQILDETAGIEIRTPSGKSWRDLIYLNAALREPGKMKYMEYVIMRQRQKEWIGAQVTACFIYALHVHDGFGIKRSARLIEQATEIRMRYNDDPKKLKAACREIIGVRIIGETA